MWTVTVIGGRQSLNTYRLKYLGHTLERPIAFRHSIFVEQYSVRSLDLPAHTATAVYRGLRRSQSLYTNPKIAHKLPL